MTALHRIKILLLATCLALAGLLAVTPAAQAEITTPQILTRTIQAYPSCLKYKVKGVCFFLHCGWTGCSIRTSIRIEHFVPDAIVSTYNSATLHPWIEVGKPVSAAMAAVGQAMLATPIPLDAAANNAREDTEMATFKSADAYGNPAGMILQVFLSQQLPNLPEQFGIPGWEHVMGFPLYELPTLQSRWLSVPGTVGGNILQGAADLAAAPGEILDKLAGLPGKVADLQSSIGKVGDIMNGTQKISGMAMTVGQLAGIDLGPINDAVSLATMATSSPLGQIFCPGSAAAFTLFYQSDLDSYFWRNVIPLEMLYPESWVPSMSEVSDGTLPPHTWGGRYPRDGHLVQSHPVKASAVYAERVRSIIMNEYQPHIYKQMETMTSGWHYFSTQSETRWQRLDPNPTSGCQKFGTNDTLSLTSWGDFNTSSTDGYVWNMWNKYDCCQKRGSFLFSIP